MVLNKTPNYLNNYLVQRVPGCVAAYQEAERLVEVAPCVFARCASALVPAIVGSTGNANGITAALAEVPKELYRNQS